ncbi:MAG: hypothetical protein ACQESC_04840, partial [Nanobdellota archaeon]
YDEEIENGYCAEDAEGFSINDYDESITVSSGSNPLFSCSATCNPSTGACEYHNYTECECSSENTIYSDDVCDGVSAEHLFAENVVGVCIEDGEDYFSCEESCKVFTEIQRESACYCKVEEEGFNTPVFENNLTEFENYFSNKVFVYDNVNSNPYVPQDSACCDDSQLAITHSSYGEKVCFDGDIYENGIISNGFEDIDLLSYDGNIYCCNETMANGNGGIDTSFANFCSPYSGDIGEFECTGDGWVS